MVNQNSNSMSTVAVLAKKRLAGRASRDAVAWVCGAISEMEEQLEESSRNLRRLVAAAKKHHCGEPQPRHCAICDALKGLR